MPVVRNISSRRSKRLSTQELISNDEDGWESCPGELLYPDSEPETIASPAPQSRSASLIVPPPPPPSRPSHARQRPEDHIPRPPNPFIVFRSDYCVWNRQLDSGAVRDHRLVSKLAGQAWAALDSASRKKYEDLAREKKRLHAIQYPDYAYAPSSRSGGKGKKRKANDDRDYEERMPQSKRRKSRGGAQPLNVTACVESVNPHSPTNCGRKQSSLTLTAAPSLDFSRSQTPELSPNSSSESPDPEPVLRTPTATSLDLVYDDDDFVPTADIPPLYLDADAPSETNKALAIGHALKTFENPSLQNAGYNTGFKPEISLEERAQLMFYNADGTHNALIGAAPSSSWAADDLYPINYAEVQFTNPFEFDVALEDWIHTDYLH